MNNFNGITTVYKKNQYISKCIENGIVNNDQVLKIKDGNRTYTFRLDDTVLISTFLNVHNEFKYTSVTKKQDLVL